MSAPPHLHWHTKDAQTVLLALGADERGGLSAAEAAARLQQHGPNELPEDKHKPMWKVFASQFASPLIYILFVAAVISFAMGHASDAVVILVVVLINALIGAVQEGRAEHSMTALRKLSALRLRVVRDGSESIIEARELVPGDILLLGAGDQVGADARLLEAVALEATEAALTGESLPVLKHTEVVPEDAGLGDRRNMIYSGTHLTAGRGRAVVVATGLQSEVGKIARLTATAEEPKTPLEVRLKQFGNWLVIASVVLFALILSFGLLRGIPFGLIFMVAISQMVSMVPEGLPVAMTIALAVGMQRMARRGAIVRRLAAVETLGSTSVICSDKTGTLTKNEMTVTTLLLPDGRRIEATGAGYSPEGKLLADGKEITADHDGAMMHLLEAITLCNDANLVPPNVEINHWRPLGDPTEAALLTVALKGCVEPEALRHQWPRRAEIPFDSGAKMMATQHGHGGKCRVIFKGAPEKLLDLCDPKTLNLTQTRQKSDELAAQALRVLAVAEINDVALDEEAGFEPWRGKLRFLGLLGQMDPPRDEARKAVAECLAAGIRPVMVTGDHKATGLAIATTLGIARDGDLAVDGNELELMPEQDLRASLDQISVFARVHPAQKLRIVEAFQSQRQVVAMTGDGVNDAPALAAADVGVAMGITGTEVAKGAAKIVVTDDNFATIVKAVEEGRLVYQNLKKVILYLLATSMAEVLVLLGALLAGLPLPLVAVQILWINIVTEGTVTVNLIMEPLEGDEMRRKPNRLGESLLSRDLMRRVLLMTPTMVASTLGFFIWRLSTGVPYELVQSETFTVLAVCQWFNVLNCRSATHTALSLDIFKNYWLLGGLVLGNLLHLAVIYTDTLNHIFHTVPIPLADFFLIGLVASSVLWVEELRKWLARRRR
ncbi:HAD-IC family P-type ATPase [Prosthecobacter sp.]|uniref:cation-translocating P-type ATPase n=1 Tax=Prosthecobacter sp. TaxID=1965333 RepID=UPI001D9786F6|nr:HAD-IC family P-type ATPase [Prosthecobacter sp.]MCB1279346.1 HAD-IC family P-type ATPase [Prosthecobacter sp.]